MTVKSILITGGSGFFGRSLTRYLLDNNLAERICIYSRGEHSQASMRCEMDDDHRLRFFIGCVRDKNRLRTAMHGVDTVVHAAALKRVEVAQYNPIEVIRTNVDGAINIVEVCAEVGVKRVVALSTDKAVEPVNVYGASKMAAERIFLSANDMYGKSGPMYSVVRYGNVWRSAGSVVPKWQAMVNAGSRCVPVTDPECTRFFMRGSEAVDLVVSTLFDMKGGELITPSLPAYRLGDLAAAMGAGFNIIGLPPFEKKHETMDGIIYSNQVRQMSIEELQDELGIRYARPSINSRDIKAVIRCLRSGNVAQGNLVPEFERKLAEYVGCTHAIAVSSGTAALHLAYLSIGVGPNNQIMTSPNTFIATANAAKLCGAGVSFCDIEPGGNITQWTVNNRIYDDGWNYPAAVVPVHFAGVPCDVKGIRATYNGAIIEDACHALGAEVEGYKVGSCAHSDATVFSTHAIKTICTGEGGIIATNSDDIAAFCRAMRDHGRSGDDFVAHGFNYRMSDIQAALGISQMERIDELLSARDRVARFYDSALPVYMRMPELPGGVKSANHLYPIFLPQPLRLKVIKAFEWCGIESRIHYRPVYTWKAFGGHDEDHCPTAFAHYLTELSIPCHAELTESQQDFIVSTLLTAIK